MQSLLTGLDDAELKQMQLGLAHSISRYTLSFTSEKVDTMIIQAVSLLEDLDKELNNYAMRLRNGTPGISLKWVRLSPITLPMLKL